MVCLVPVIVPLRPRRFGGVPDLTLTICTAVSVRIRSSSALAAGLGIPLRVLVQTPAAEGFDAEARGIDWKRFPVRKMAARGYFGARRVGRELRDSAEDLVREFLAPLRSQAIHAFTKQSHHVRSGRPYDEYALLAWTARVMGEALKQRPATVYRVGSVDDDFMRQVAQLSHPVIGMTLRYDRLDSFWYCLMHELAHIRLHLQKSEYVYYDDLDPREEHDPREIEADDLAQECLVPRAEWDGSAASQVRSPDAAASLAKRLHVHPAVVAGRMRHHWGDFTILTPLLGHVRPLFPEFERNGE
jgi:HTH-type transcriptional regulator/antitoxin HigA